MALVATISIIKFKQIFFFIGNFKFIQQLQILTHKWFSLVMNFLVKDIFFSFTKSDIEMEGLNPTNKWAWSGMQWIASIFTFRRWTNPVMYLCNSSLCCFWINQSRCSTAKTNSKEIWEKVLQCFRRPLRSQGKEAISYCSTINISFGNPYILEINDSNTGYALHACHSNSARSPVIMGPPPGRNFSISAKP